MPSERLRDERASQVLEAWKAIVEVQQHFNEIAMRIRSWFVTILLGLFASIGFLLDNKLSLTMGPVAVQFAVLVPLFGVFGTELFYFMDRFWYHRLLVGSVKHAIAIEERYKDELPELSLSAAIGKESPFKPSGVFLWAAKRLVSHDRFKETGQLHSDGKIELFYKSVRSVLFLTFGLIALFGGVTVNIGADTATLPEALWHLLRYLLNSSPGP